MCYTIYELLRTVHKLCDKLRGMEMWKKRGSNSCDVIHRNHTLLTCCVILLHMWFPANKTSSNAQLHLAIFPSSLSQGYFPFIYARLSLLHFLSLQLTTGLSLHFHNSISLSTSQRYVPYTFTRLSISPPSSQGYLSVPSHFPP